MAKVRIMIIHYKFARNEASREYWKRRLLETIEKENVR